MRFKAFFEKEQALDQLNEANISFDKQKYEALKKAHADAHSKGLHQFKFEGHDMVTGYAKYMVEYLRTKFGDAPTKEETELTELSKHKIVNYMTQANKQRGDMLTIVDDPSASKEQKRQSFKTAEKRIHGIKSSYGALGLSREGVNESFDHDVYSKYHGRASSALKDIEKHLDNHKGFADKKETEGKSKDYLPYIDHYDIKEYADQLEGISHRIGKTCESKKRDEEMCDKIPQVKAAY